MTPTDARNKQAKDFITDKLNLVEKLTESNFKTISNFQQVKSILQDLIFVKAMGFRGIVATAITGKFIDPTFDPLNNFYSCHPRSIFEQGIFYAFEGRIPCGKSDPLNVAKNIYVLNDDWANGKRPQKAAKAAVKYLKLVEAASGNEQEQLINYFFFRLLEYATSVVNIGICLPTTQGLSNQIFGSKLKRFVLAYPESGTIPQLVVSILLNQIYEKSAIAVMGGDESVFGTNTTSKKPADIWLEYDNTPYNLFEITVKKVDNKRLDDCIQSLNSMGMLDKKISFICRMPDDISTLDNVTFGSLNYKGKTFDFVDIGSFITTISMLLSDKQIEAIMLKLTNFISKIDRPITTKNGWNKIFN
jgi:hypothetical protein